MAVGGGAVGGRSDTAGAASSAARNSSRAGRSLVGSGRTYQ